MSDMRRSTAILDNIERIRMPDPQTFWKDYVLQQRPVIITDLFDEKPIRRLSSMAQVAEALGDIQVSTHPEYIGSLLDQLRGMLAGVDPSAAPPPAVAMTLREYFALIRENPGSERLIAESPAPPEVLAVTDVPVYARDTKPGEYFKSDLWVANAGNVSSLHYDGDHAQVLLYQVFGRKRFILVPPRAAKRLAPIEIYGSVLLHNFEEADKKRFLEYVGAYECVLAPGETIFMPALIWHHVEYIDDAMSINFRFGRNKYTEFLTKLHRNLYVQNVAAKMIDPEAVAARYAPVMAEIEEVYGRSYPSAYDKYKAVDGLMRDIYARICTDSVQGGEYYAPIFDSMDRALPFLYGVYDEPPAEPGLGEATP